MAHLTKAKVYDIKDSNIALLGSDLEKHVREEAGDSEVAWDIAGKEAGLQIWRIEKFHVVPWPKERYGSFYDGDSYIVLNTYRKSPESDSLSYDLHFWLGQSTSQDEAGTAAYKTVELDDQLNGVAVQYREVQGYETPRFVSYFARFVVLKGGVATGFQHVSDPPPLNIFRLYRISVTQKTLLVREVPAQADSLVAGDAYVLDKGEKVLQFNSKSSAPRERFRAAEFVQELLEPRKGQCDVIVYDEGSPGAGVFLGEFGPGTTMRPHPSASEVSKPILFRLSDASGKPTFERVPLESGVHSSDVFLLDAFDILYVWIGLGSSLNERRMVGEYAQRYLYDKETGGNVAIPIVKMHERQEVKEFEELLTV